MNPPPAWHASGSARNATISRRRRPGRNSAGSAGAEGQQQLVPDLLVEIREVQLLLALVTEHFDDGGTPLFTGFDARILAQLHDMHLQGLDQEVPVVPTAGTRERHLSGTPLDSYKPSNSTGPHSPDAIRFAGKTRSSRRGSVVPAPRVRGAEHEKYFNCGRS